MYIYINEYNIPSLFQYLAQLMYIYMLMFIPMIHEPIGINWLVFSDIVVNIINIDQIIDNIMAW
jgi:hypothetical protein